jgi:hypothetical protein
MVGLVVVVCGNVAEIDIGYSDKAPETWQPGSSFELNFRTWCVAKSTCCMLSCD